MSSRNKITRPSKRINPTDKESMSSMRKNNEEIITGFRPDHNIFNKKEIIAIFAADLHLTLNPPVWRSAESNWLKVQARVLGELDDLTVKYDCPIFYAGDICDRPIVSTELANWVSAHLSPGFAIPGQHDLPDHRYEDIHKTVFQSLIDSKVITEIKYDRPINTFSGKLSRLEVWGFPFGKEIKKQSYKSEQLKIAIAHKYVWSGKHHYPDAPEESKLTGNKTDYIDRKWFGYDVIIYGDNHKGFTVGMGKTTVFNCGTLMRRKSDEINYKPQVGLLTKSGEVIPYYLDISKDKYIDAEEESVEAPEDLDTKALMTELEKLGKTDFDFGDAMNHCLNKGVVTVLGKVFRISPEAKQIILEAMEK